MIEVQLIDVNGNPYTAATGSVVLPTTFSPAQVLVSVINTPANLPVLALANGIFLRAAPTNKGTIFIKDVNTVNTINDGTGNAIGLEAGAYITFPLDNASRIWWSGDTLNDFFYWGGN